jgi:hypothetical protein
MVYAREKITPQEVLINAFGYFGAQAMDQESLVRIAIAANCPSAEIAIRVLLNMADDGLLLKEERDNQVIYSLPPKPDNDQIQ